MSAEEAKYTNGRSEGEEVFPSHILIGIASDPDVNLWKCRNVWRDWEYIFREGYQYAGLLLLPQPAYGVLFHVPAEAELGEVGKLYEGTCWSNKEYPHLGSVELLAHRLSRLGLILRTDSAADIGESLFPLEVRNAWDFVVREGLQVWKWPQGRRPGVLTDRSEAGMDSWENLVAYLTGFLKDMHEGKDIGEQDWVAIYSYPNSD